MFSNLFENLTAKLIRFTKEIYTTVNKNEEYFHDFKKELAASKNQSNIKLEITSLLGKIYE